MYRTLIEEIPPGSHGFRDLGFHRRVKLGIFLEIKKVPPASRLETWIGTRVKGIDLGPAPTTVCIVPLQPARRYHSGWCHAQHKLHRNLHRRRRRPWIERR